MQTNRRQCFIFINSRKNHNLYCVLASLQIYWELFIAPTLAIRISKQLSRTTQPRVALALPYGLAGLAAGVMGID